MKVMVSCDSYGAMLTVEQLAISPLTLDPNL